MVKGWKEKSKLKIDDLLNLYKGSKIKGYIVTDIDYVKKNQAEMLKDIELAYERFNFAKYPKADDNS